ncbi:MAG TPA: Gfo/Idh/MocA family oxidoreductase [Candidatus Acidoferrales bacterium]|nr:Gfo/Idh/MocA family oxidoreductase [Candidatus Acidoferrales bacterium]
MPEQQLRLGVVGLGRAASSMLPSLAAHPGVTIAGAAEPLADLRERFAADVDVPAYDRIETLCDREELDAVYVATPHQQHVHDVTYAAGRGLHAIVEKPMALSLEDCRAMIDAAQRAGTVIVVGHTHGFDPAIKRMREIVASGELGALRMIANVVYSDFLYRPRRPEELDSAAGGGIMYNQVPHQIEIARTLDGGRLRSVKAVSGIWDPARPTEGAMAALLEFESGVVASLTYSGYDHFDSDELAFWVGESGAEKSAFVHGASRTSLRGLSPQDEARMKAASGLGGRGVRRTADPVHQPHFGMLLVSCERGDMRPSADGVLVYDDRGKREIALPPARAFPNKDNVIDELYDAVVHAKPALHDGRWGMATVEAALALIVSSRERREVPLTEEVVHG